PQNHRTPAARGGGRGSAARNCRDGIGSSLPGTEIWRLPDECADVTGQGAEIESAPGRSGRGCQTRCKRLLRKGGNRRSRLSEFSTQDRSAGPSVADGGGRRAPVL